MRIASRILASAAIATCAVLISAASANAAVIPDLGDPASRPTIVSEDAGACPLQEVDGHWARCHVLTGGNHIPRSAGGQPVTSILPSDGQNCPLRRVGRQLVRCDYLTGGHVEAPLSVPEA
jgi:hypothetical protein